MNKTGKRIFILYLLFTFLSLSQEKTTLNQCIEFVLKNNQSIKVNESALLSNELKIDEAKSIYYPQVSLSAGYTRLSMVSEMSFFNPIKMREESIKFNNLDNYSLKFSLSEQVFNWGRTARTIEMNESGFNLSKYGVDFSRFLTAYQVVPLFYGILFTNQALKVIDDNINLLEKNLSIQKERYNSGLASSFDISMIEVQITSLKGQKIDFQNNTNKITISYNRLAGKSLNSAFQPEGILDFQPLNIRREELLNHAIMNRLEFKQLKLQNDLTRSQIELSRTGDKPTVVFGFNYEFRNGFMPDMDKIKGNWNAILSASYPIFDGFKTKLQVQQGEANLKNLDDKKDDLLQQLEMEIDQNLSDINSIEQKIEIERIKIKQSEDALKIAEERFKSGLISATDFIAAQNGLTGANLNKIQLIYNHILAKYNLFRAIGKKIFE